MFSKTAPKKNPWTHILRACLLLIIAYVLPKQTALSRIGSTVKNSDAAINGLIYFYDSERKNGGVRTGKVLTGKT